MPNLFHDIETLPTSKPEVIETIRAGIKHPGNISKQETIDKWYAENFESAFQEAFRKTALDGLYGEIFCIGFAIDDAEPDVFYRMPEDSEAELLTSFFEKLVSSKKTRSLKWIGHNILGFDLRFIWQRCVINRIKPPFEIPYDARSWDDRVFDTRAAWTGGSNQYSGRSAMSALSPIFGLNKSEIDGSMVYDMWLDGKLEEIAQYCKEDVEDTRSLYKRMTFAD